ncbi:hypothetical protein LTR17_023956 [Elasticomyces elasticus]|nr:hypothetical protein LTR17_023956 [Elasticomyces elasticus]
MDDKQSAVDDETKPVLETHTAPLAVVFKCTPCYLHFKTEKQLQNHIRYARAYNISSGSATAEDPITYDSFDMRSALHDHVSRLLETLTQHNSPHSTAHTFQSESTDDKQSAADSENKPLPEAHDAPSDVVFKQSAADNENKPLPEAYDAPADVKDERKKKREQPAEVSPPSA